jgi:hypothetical protein
MPVLGVDRVDAGGDECLASQFAGQRDVGGRGIDRRADPRVGAGAVVEAFAAPPSTAALANRSRPSVSVGVTRGVTFVSQVLAMMSRRPISASRTWVAASGSVYLPCSTSNFSCASVNAATRRAPQKASSGRMLRKAALGYSAFHSSGSKPSAK